MLQGMFYIMVEIVPLVVSPLKYIFATAGTWMRRCINMHPPRSSEQGFPRPRKHPSHGPQKPEPNELSISIFTRG